VEGNLVDRVLKQLLWELGGHQALECQVTEIEQRSRNRGEGHRDPNRGDSDRGCQPKRSIESNKPSNLHNLLVLRKRVEPQRIEDAYEMVRHLCCIVTTFFKVADGWKTTFSIEATLSPLQQKPIL